MVVKNTLLHKALESLEEDFSPLYGSLKGTTAVMFCNTANVPAKLIKDKAKDGIPGLKAAYAEESFYVGADQLDALVAIKSKNEVIADIVALLQSPAKNVISALQSGGNTPVSYTHLDVYKRQLYKNLVYNLVKRNLSKVATLKKRSPHVLRHTFATTMLNNEAELGAVKELLGHESIATTEIYTHATFEELKKVYKHAHPRA